jgi:hypothetical protein
LTNLNRAQGLGFKMFGGTVVDKRLLAKVIGGLATGSITIVSGCDAKQLCLSRTSSHEFGRLCRIHLC